MTPEQYEVIKAAWDKETIYESRRKVAIYYDKIITSDKFDRETGCKYDGPIPIEKFIELYYKWLLRGKS